MTVMLWMMPVIILITIIPHCCDYSVDIGDNDSNHPNNPHCGDESDSEAEDNNCNNSDTPLIQR